MIRFAPVTPHLDRLELRFCGSIVNVFLVRHDDEWTLIDAGPSNAPEVAATVEARIGKSPTRLILTHGHSDHAGNAHELVQRWQIPVWAHEAEVPFIEGTKGYADIRPSHLAHRVLSRYLDASMRAVEVTHRLQDGEWIGPMQVVHVPGHAPGMIALLHQQDRALIGADTWRFKPFGGAMPLCTYDRKSARHSMRKLALRDFDHLLLSHNAPILHQGRQRALQASVVAQGDTFEQL